MEVAYSTKTFEKSKLKTLFNAFYYDRRRQITCDPSRIKFIAIILVNLMTNNSRILYWYAFEQKLSLNTGKYPCSEKIV